MPEGYPSLLFYCFVLWIATLERTVCVTSAVENTHHKNPFGYRSVKNYIFLLRNASQGRSQFFALSPETRIICEKHELRLESFDKTLRRFDTSLPSQIQRDFKQVFVGSVREQIIRLHACFYPFANFWRTRCRSSSGANALTWPLSACSRPRTISCFNS
jgi:hypothetical protein